MARGDDDENDGKWQGTLVEAPRRRGSGVRASRSRPRSSRPTRSRLAVGETVI